MLLTFNHSVAHTIQLHIYMAHFPLLFSPLEGFSFAPLCVPFVFPSTYLAPSRCDRNCPPQSQVARKLTPLVPHYSLVPSPPNSQPFLGFPELNVHLIRAHHKPPFQYTTQEQRGVNGEWQGEQRTGNAL